MSKSVVKAEFTYAVAKRLKELRRKKGLKQFEVSKTLGLDRSTIAKYETGVAAPNIVVLIHMAKLYEASADYILGLKDY